jgi:hypothetical protein
LLKFVQSRNLTWQEIFFQIFCAAENFVPLLRKSAIRVKIRVQAANVLAFVRRVRPSSAPTTGASRVP